MQHEKPIDLLCFEKSYDAIFQMAIGEVSPFIESLNLNDLEKEERSGRIYLAIEKVWNEMDRLNRYQYVKFYKDKPILFDLFKTSDRLNNAHEMQKLQNAISCVLIHECLIFIKMKGEIIQQTDDLLARNKRQLPEVMEERNISLLGGTVALPGSVGKTFLSQGLSREHMINIIIVMLNHRFGFLVHPLSVRQFAHWVMNPELEGPKMQLGCMTNEFKCIIDHFKRFNPELSPVLVGLHGMFISKSGHEITDRNFRNTTYGKLNTRHAIANIFDLFI